MANRNFRKNVSAQNEQFDQVENGNLNQASDHRKYPGNYNRSYRGGRSGGFSHKTKETRKPIDTVQKPKNDGPPMGQHLSKTTSALKNDPLYMDAFMPSPSEELVPIAEEVNHTPGFNGLTTIINESFEVMAAKSQNFKRNVPPAAYAYYISVFAWARVLKLKQMNRYRLTTAELEFVEMIYEQGNYVLPKSIGIYLSGFGNFKIPSGPDSKFNTIPYVLDEDGFFEDFADTFITALYPCISVYSQRIMADLIFTRDGGNPGWNVDGEELPWNNRCLGYELAQHLSDMQTRIYQSGGITADNFPSDCDILHINTRLLNNVQKYINEVPTIETVPIPVSLTGTIGQMIICEPQTIRRMQIPEDVGGFNFTAESSLECSGSISFLSGTFLYRINKSEAHHGFFFPFDIGIPTEAELEQLNMANNNWSPLLHNITHYSNVPFKSNLRMKKVCSIDVKSI